MHHRQELVVLSGKGGVGKSTVAANLAFALAMEGMKVGLLDVDIHGPSIPNLLGLEGAQVTKNGKTLNPVDTGGIKVMSIGFMLGHPDDPIIWRGPVKMGLIQQFIEEVAWGDIDVLVVDCPPGTGDEPLSVCQLLPNPTGAIIVTTPQRLAEADVRKSINFCFKLELPVLGIVENMTTSTCPHCGGELDLFPKGAGERLAQDFSVPLLGRIPVDPAIGVACDDGTPFVQRFRNTPAARVLLDIASLILDRVPAGTRTET